MFGKLQDLLAGFDTSTGSALSLSGVWDFRFREKAAQAEPVEARTRRWSLALAVLAALSLGATTPADPIAAASKDIAAACGTREGWSDPAPPAHIYGNTWYVGTCGITVVLIETKAGLVLIDSGPDDAAPQVLANIKALGFDPRQVKWLLMTHEHFDHAGGLAALKRATRAKIAARGPAATVLTSGKPDPNDPQFGMLQAMEPVMIDRQLEDGDIVEVGALRLTTHATPVHTDGSTSWTWQSCEGKLCLTIAYADSATTPAVDGYRFTTHPERAAAVFQGMPVIGTLPCDLLITPHPSASALFPHLSGKAPLIETGACERYAQAAARAYAARVTKERSGS